MPAIGSHGDAPRKKKTYKVQSNPDTANRGKDLKRAETFKKTKTYKTSIKTAYASKPVKQRSEDVKHARASKKPSAEQREVLRVHDDRMERDRKEIKRKGYLEREAYASYLRRRAGSKEIPAHLLDSRPVKQQGDGPGESGDRADTRTRDFARARDFTERIRATDWGEEGVDIAGKRVSGFEVKREPNKRYRAILDEAGGDKRLRSVEAASTRGGNDVQASMNFGPELAQGAVTSAAAIAEATARDLVGVPVKTALSVPKAAAALPGAVVEMVTKPGKTFEAIVESADTGYKDKVKRIREEGALEDIGNAALAAGPAGRAVALTALKRAAPRAAKLNSGGTAVTPKTGGPVRYTIGRAMDASKAKHYERKANQGRPLKALENEALKLNQDAGRVVAVVPTRSGRKMAKVVADARGKAIAALKWDTAKGPFSKLAKERFNLNDAEAAALWLGTAVGVRDAATARTIGQALRDKMVEGRKAADPKGHERDMDVIEQIDKILEDPDKHFTPRFAEVMDRIREHTEQITEAQPQFKTATTERRRRAVQAWVLGLERGEGADAPPTGRAKVSKEELVILNKDPKTLTAAERAVLDGVAARVMAAKGGAGVPGHAYDSSETDADFAARVDAAAEKAGLAAPTYFRSEKQQGLAVDYGAHVVGGGSPKSTGGTYLGKNTEIGIFDTSWDQFLRGYAHNVKATHNYPLIAKLDDANRLRSLSPDNERNGRGAILTDLMNRVNQYEPTGPASRLDKGSVVFVNKGLYEKALDDPDAPDMGEYDTPEDHATAMAAYATSKAVVEGDAPPTHLAKTEGWVAWPKEALRELEAELSAGGQLRKYDVLKGKASQAMLLTMNLPWLVLQGVSEFGVAGLASGGRALTPRNAWGTRRWWKAMNHRQRLHVATEIGMGATGSDTAAIKLGSTTNSRLINHWRDLKARDFWHRPRVKGVPISTGLNPIQWMRAADRGKTNISRLLLAHSELTKHVSPRGIEHLTDALDEMNAAGKAVERLLPVFEKPSAEQLQHLVDNPEIMEGIGKHLDNAMGNWTSLTARERKVANRLVMFYPFVRYSTRMLLYTMPVDHPAVTSVLAELGQLHAEEYREIFGDDDLPWNLGKIYFGKTGESKYIDLSRAHPVMNAAISGLARVGTSSENLPGAAIGMLPPYFQWAFDQAAGVNSFRGRTARLEGDTNPEWNPAWKRGPDVVGKLALAQIQSLFYPLREAQSRKEGPQSDESSLLFPQGMDYKKESEITGNSADAKLRRLKARNAATDQKFRAENDGGWLDWVIGPLAPRKSRDAAASRERAYVKKLQAEADKKAAQRKAYRDAHGGKNPPGPKAKKSPFKGRSGGKKGGFK